MTTVNSDMVIYPNPARDELNVVLAFSGFFVRDDGRVGYADKATTLDAARARAGRL